MTDSESQSTSSPSPDDSTKPAPSGRWRFALTLSAILLAIALPIYWHKVLRHEIFPRNFGIVTESQIYRSGQLTERMLRHVIDKYDLTTIIALSDGTPESVMEKRVCDELGVLRIPFTLAGNGTGSPESYAQVLHSMKDPARQPLLVHCASGAQRAGASVLLYRHIVEGISIAEAYPESFKYKHKPDEWILLASLAENLPAIRDHYQRLQELPDDQNDP